MTLRSALPSSSSSCRTCLAGEVVRPTNSGRVERPSRYASRVTASVVDTAAMMGGGHVSRGQLSEPPPGCPRGEARPSAGSPTPLSGRARLTALPSLVYPKRWMRWYLASLAPLLLLECRGSYEPPAPVLSLAPAGMQSSGPSANFDDHTRCLMPGASVEASVYVQRSTVTIVVVAFTPSPDAIPSFLLHWGGRTVALETVRSARAKASVYRVEASRGEQILSVEVPPTSPGVLCLDQVVLTQP